MVADSIVFPPAVASFKFEQSNSQEKRHMQNPPPGQATKSSTGLDENIAALLAYLFGWVSGLVFFLIEKDSKLVRFHAMQSILLNVVILAICVVLWILSFVLILMMAMLP